MKKNFIHKKFFNAHSLANKIQSLADFINQRLVGNHFDMICEKKIKSGLTTYLRTMFKFLRFSNSTRLTFLKRIKISP